MCPVSAVLGSKIVVGRSVAIEQNWVLFRGPVACSSAGNDLTAAWRPRCNESTRYVHRPIASWYADAGFERLGGSRCGLPGIRLEKSNLRRRDQSEAGVNAAFQWGEGEAVGEHADDYHDDHDGDDLGDEGVVFAGF